MTQTALSPTVQAPQGAPAAPYARLDPKALRAAASEHGTPLLLLSTRTVRARYRALERALPGVALHYAVKSLPHPAIVRALARERACFDVASAGELSLVRSAGVAGIRCLHSHPVKRADEIEAALALGCRTFVFDNAAELDKLEPHAGELELLLRLSFPNERAQCDLSAKFGARPGAAARLLAEAAGRGLRVRGLSFHVGSQVEDPWSFVSALRSCRAVVDAARGEGLELDTIDIGGGFPVSYTRPVPAIGELCAPIRVELRRSFPEARVLTEPGRFISAPGMTLVTSVVGVAEREGEPWFYLDDGVYGSYSGRLFDRCDYALIPVRTLERPDLPHRPSVIAGPTCDSIDVVAERAPMPAMACGDLVVTPMIGAYSWASATDFNSLRRAKVVVAD